MNKVKKNDNWAIKDPVTGAVINMDYSSVSEKKNRNELISSFRSCPIPDESILSNLGLFFTSKTLSRILFLHEFYLKGIDIMGQIFDFGTRWGQNISIFMACRGIYEPFNRHRKIVGFDTFGGFPHYANEDGESTLIGKGNIGVTDEYFSYVSKLLATLDENSLPHLTKFELMKGDASEKIIEYFNKNPHAIVSHAFFDFDLYKPTKDCLEIILQRTPKGGVIGFDEINDEDSPGETKALFELFPKLNIKLIKPRNVSRVCYFIKE
jgi:hypothetical protein